MCASFRCLPPAAHSSLFRSLPSSLLRLYPGLWHPPDACRHICYTNAQSTSQLVEKVAQQPIHPFSINGIIKYTAKDPNQDWLCTSANWIQKEMPVRLAHRLHDFNRLPHVVVSNPYIELVYELYCDAFEQLYRYGTIRGADQEQAFTDMLILTVKKHADVVTSMAQGVSELRVTHPDIVLDGFLDRFFVTRIGNRVLAEHHIAHHQLDSSRPDYCGIVNRHAQPAKILQSVADKVCQNSLMAYGLSPNIILSGDVELSFPYIPEHIRYVAYELLKNSVRATVETNVQDDELPPILVSIYKGNSDVFIKICDRGGGIPTAVFSDIWKYGFTTVNDLSYPSSPGESSASVKSAVSDVTSDEWCVGIQLDSTALSTGEMGASDNYGLGQSMHSGGVFSKLEMAGYGFGVPMSRLYTRYFGGDLDIKTMEGIGTDTYVLLPRLGNQRESDIMLHNQLYPYRASATQQLSDPSQYSVFCRGSGSRGNDIRAKAFCN